MSPSRMGAVDVAMFSGSSVNSGKCLRGRWRGGGGGRNGALVREGCGSSSALSSESSEEKWGPIAEAWPLLITVVFRVRG